MIPDDLSGMDVRAGEVEITPEIREAARTTRMMYAALVEQGFGAAEALKLVGMMLAGVQRG